MIPKQKPLDMSSFRTNMAALADSIKKGVPMICVPDVAATLDWYASIGFKELARYGEDGVVDFGMVSFGKAELMLRLDEEPRSRSGNIWFSHGVTLWFYTDQVDNLYQLLKARQLEAAQAPVAGEPGNHAGIEFTEDIYDPFYGGRQFSIRDPNGYILLFLQP